MKHSVRVDWFQRDPGGGTIFVMPVPESGAAQSAGPRADEAPAAADSSTRLYRALGSGTG